MKALLLQTVTASSKANIIIEGIALGLVAVVSGVIIAAIAKTNKQGVVIAIANSYLKRGIAGIALGTIGIALSGWLLITLY